MKWPFKLLFKRPTEEQPAAVKVVAVKEAPVPIRRDWSKLPPLTPTLSTVAPVIGVVRPMGPITADTRPLTDHSPRPEPQTGEEQEPVRAQPLGEPGKVFETITVTPVGRAGASLPSPMPGPSPEPPHMASPLPLPP
ncbi:MAG: hypothetical protein H0T78_04325, partial [Longispora sp.]|nr:hypothetical protein [Longispora sp. (in: high G+C Gram-positive bacteria)]